MVERLIIEGGSDTRNGELRRGFYQLLSKEVEDGLIPRIQMGDSKKESIKKFLSSKNSVSLLIDLDHKESFRMQDIDEHNLQSKQEHVFYMIQEMEAWFLSQPDLLTSFYKDIDWEDFKDTNVCEISKPSETLQERTRRSSSRKYHKIKHAVELLPQLDTKRLAVDFPDFKKLIDTIKN